MKIIKWTAIILMTALSLFLTLKLNHLFAVDNPNDDFSVKKNHIVSQPPVVTLENIIVDELKPVGSIIGSYKKDKYLKNMDAVYLKLPNHPVSVGDKFMVFNDLGGVKVPGAFLKTTGRSITVKGFAQVSEVTQTGSTTAVVAKLYDTNIDVQIGDSIGEILPNLNVKIAPQESSVDIRGTILSAAKDQKFIGPYEFAYINKGLADGLKLNDRLFVFRTSDNEAKVTKDLPEVNIAELAVAHITDHHATVYCVGSAESFEAGSQFKSAKSAVQYLK